MAMVALTAICVASRMKNSRGRLLSAHAESSWEVVDHKVVHPVFTLEDDEDIDIIRITPSETRATYVFESRKRSGGRNALIFARQQLLLELAKNGYNALVREGWQLTVLQRDGRHRIEVQYHGRGALTSEDLPPRLPPFLDLLGKN